MSNQPSQGPDYERSNSPWPSYQQPPQPGQPQHGPRSYGQGQYGQAPYNQQQYGRAPYNQARYNPSPYNQPQYFGGQSYYGGAAEPKALSIASMVCGFASVIMGWLLLPQFAAIITGHLALRREPSGKGMSITGLVLGYLCLLGYGALLLLFIIGVAIAGSTGSNTGTF